MWSCAAYYVQNRVELAMNGKVFLSWVFSGLFGVAGVVRLVAGPAELWSRLLAVAMIGAALAWVWVARRTSQNG